MEVVRTIGIRTAVWIGVKRINTTWLEYFPHTLSLPRKGMQENESPFLDLDDLGRLAGPML